MQSLVVNWESVTSLVAQAVPGLWALYLYGSWARPQPLPEADVGLALLAAEPLESRLLLDLADRIALQLHRDVDLVDLRQVPLPLRVEAIFRGVTLFDGFPAKRAAFEGQTLAFYACLNEERREVLQRIGEEGRIYG